MATTTISYAATASITLTQTSLTNGSYRQSTAVDNSSNKYVDALVGGSVQAGTSPTSGGTLDFFVYAERDDGGGTSQYTAGCSGSDAAYTADGEEDELFSLYSVTVDATSDQDYEWGPVSVAQAFGGVMPRKWGVVLKNSSGVTTNATGTNNEVRFAGIKYEIA